MTQLYKLTEQLREVERIADDLDDETLHDTLEGLNLEFDDKVVNIARWTKNLSADAEACKSEGNRLLALAKTYSVKADSLKEYVRMQMIGSDKRKVPCPTINISLRKAPEKLGEFAEENVPSQFITVETITKVDRRALLAYAKANPDPLIPVVRGSDSLSIE